MTAATFIECGAAIFGVLGTLLLATKSRWAGFGFVAFFASNVGWLTFSFSHGFRFMFWQQVAFTISSVLGVWVWLLKDRVTLFLARARAPRDTQSIEQEIWKRFNGRNAAYLGTLFGFTVDEVFDIVSQRQR